MLTKSMGWLKKLYFNKPKLSRLLFGRDPDLMSVFDVKAELLRLRVMMWLWVVVACFIVVGTWLLKRELDSALAALPLKACYDALSICQGGIPLDWNISLSFGGV